MFLQKKIKSHAIILEKLEDDLVSGVDERVGAL